MQITRTAVTFLPCRLKYELLFVQNLVVIQFVVFVQQVPKFFV